MKKLSLITHTLITEFLHGLAFVILGLLSAPEFAMVDSWPDWLRITIKVILIIFVAMPIVVRLFFRKYFDVWDETAKEHQLEAKDIGNSLMGIAMMIIAVLLMSDRLATANALEMAENQKMFSASLGASVILALYGAVEICQSLCFIYLEKRGV